MEQIVADPEWHDPDTTKVIAILGGASKSLTDPDIELAKLVSDLSRAVDEASYEQVLQKLISDAHPH